MPLPRWAKPAIGGVLVGLMALAIPEVLGTGYGWVQEGLGRQLLSLPLWIVLILPFARILATGLSIGSGGQEESSVREWSSARSSGPRSGGSSSPSSLYGP